MKAVVVKVRFERRSGKEICRDIVDIRDISECALTVLFNFSSLIREEKNERKKEIDYR